jgi:hypothetical protein
MLSAVPYDRFLVQVRSRLCNDGCGHRFAPFPIGHAENGSLCDGRVRFQHVLYLPRVNIKAAGYDHILETAHDADNAVLVDGCEVTRPMTAVVKCFSGLLRRVEVGK